jgi:hypothetical protein
MQEYTKDEDRSRINTLSRISKAGARTNQFVPNLGDLQKNFQAVTKKDDPIEAAHVTEAKPTPTPEYAIEEDSSLIEDTDEDSYASESSPTSSIERKSNPHDLSVFQGGNGGASENAKARDDEKGKEELSSDDPPAPAEQDEESDDKKNYTEIKPLDLSNISAKDLILLKKRASSVTRRMGFSEGGVVYSFSEAERLLREQLASALLVLAKREVINDDTSASEILAEYNDACAQINRDCISAITDYEPEMLLGINLDRLRLEAQKTLKMSRLVEASSLRLSYKIETDFKRQKLNAVIKYLEELAKGERSTDKLILSLIERRAEHGLSSADIIAHAATKLQEYRMGKALPEEIQRLMYYAQLNFGRLIKQSTLAEVCATLAGQIHYPTNAPLKEGVHQYIKNSERCQLPLNVRQSLALAMVHNLVYANVETTAKKVSLWRGEPKYITKIKNLFEALMNDKFSQVAVTELLSAIDTQLVEALEHYQQRKTKKIAGSWTLGGVTEMLINDRLVTLFTQLKEWVDSTIDRNLIDDFVVIPGQPVAPSNDSDDSEARSSEAALMSPYSNGK